MVSLFLKRVTIIGLAGAVAIVILYNVGLVDRCPFRQIDVVNDLKKYQITKDPELCANLNERIIALNNECGTEMEVNDCG